MINTKCTFSTKYNSSLNASLQVTRYIYSLSNYTKQIDMQITALDTELQMKLKWGIADMYFDKVEIEKRDPQMLLKENKETK